MRGLGLCLGCLCVAAGPVVLAVYCKEGMWSASMRELGLCLCAAADPVRDSQPMCGALAYVGLLPLALLSWLTMSGE